MATFDDIIEGLKMLLEEQGTPRNVKEKVQKIIDMIKAPGEARIKADQILSQLEEMQSDVNIPSYVRTQIWSVSSMLEDLEE